MTSADFTTWMLHHTKIFGMTSPDNIATVAEWEKLFRVAGYSASELQAATNAIALRTERLKWRDEHLAEINRCIQESRKSEASRIIRQDERGDRTYCDLCVDAGQIVVPHPSFVKNGEWVRCYSSKPTAAILCSCLRGRRCAESIVAKKVRHPQMTIDEYERLIPRPLWREMMHGDDEFKLQAARASASARSNDKRLGPLAATIDSVLSLRAHHPPA